ncbi:MAG: nucleotidyltransferase domain-containing protein [Candidatus Cloacimonetes bacterium]|nr:nucleotidyltransferase domain-containing protein [Candidatus Cloacimonadota bacterium]
MDFNPAELAQLLEKKYPEILIAYIFGSAKNGFVKANSDIDLAVLLDDNCDKFIQFKIAVELEKFYNCKVDTVVLNSANPLLIHEVMQKGNRLFERNSAKRAMFEVNAFRDFVDSSYFLRRRYA